MRIKLKTHITGTRNGQEWPAYGQELELPDEEAASEGYVRVVDESGEDYAFVATRFHPVQLPQAVERALLAASSR